MDAQEKNVAPSVATVDTPELLAAVLKWENSKRGEPALAAWKEIIAHIDAHVATQVAAKDAEIKTLKAALDAQGELTDRYQEITLSAQAAAPMAYLRFRAARQWSGVGGSDIEYAEWYETCQAHEIGDDKKPAFPVYAVPQPSPAPVAMTDEQAWEIISGEQGLEVIDWRGTKSVVIGSPSEAGDVARAILAAQQEAV